MALLLPSFLLVDETAWPALWVPAWLHLQMVDQYTRAHLLFSVRHPEPNRPWMPASTQINKNSQLALYNPHPPRSPFVGECV